MKLLLNNTKFINSSGSEFTWASAIANNKLQAYLAYYDTNVSVSQRKYKYVATSDLGMDDTQLREDKGYWLYANEAGNLSLASVGGSLRNESYIWSKLRFSNGTSELNVTQAGSKGWIQTSMRYWGKHPIKGTYEFLYISGTSGLLTKTNMSSWEGVFVYSNQDNITLIRQN